MHTNVDPWGPQGPNAGANWQMIGRSAVRESLSRFASTFIMFLEDPMDWGLPAPDEGVQGKLEMGNHGRLGKNALGFLDAHAEYKATDTRRWCGLGWSVIVPTWRYNGLKSPPIYYKVDSYKVNCDP